MQELTNSPERSLRELLSKLWQLLSRRRRRQLAASVFLMLFSTIAEVVSLAAILPFLAMLTNPTALWNQLLVNQWASKLGISSAKELQLLITLAFAGASIAAGAIRLITLWLNGRLAAAIGSDLSCEAYRRTLYQPYEVHIARNSSKLIASISSDVNRVIGLVLNPLLLMLSSGLIALALFLTLVVVNWRIALGVAIAITLVYLLAVAISAKPLQQLSHSQVLLNRKLLQVLQEGIGSIRDVLLNSAQLFYIDVYREVDCPLRRDQAKCGFLSSYPRLVVEPSGIALISLVSYLLTVRGEGGSALPLLGTLALGAQRIIPMAQKVYEGWAQSRDAKQSLENVITLITQKLPSEELLLASEPLSFSQTIRIEQVCFRYASHLPDVVKDLTLDIKRGEKIGLIGSTGSGKSTIVDLFVGLLTPTAGRIIVDGEALHDPMNSERLFAWRTSIAYVPQSIYLADSSIAENIAFGIPRCQINLPRVRLAAEHAQIASFIESTPGSYETSVGERGIRLSGGQRQRIGIARALYKQSQVLVLDEATAALDNATEKAVMQAIEKLCPHITILMIAHRLSTLVNCDRVIELAAGGSVNIGLPSDVLPLSP